jgi:hypothetical protein
LRAWNFADTTSIYADLLGSAFLTSIESRATSLVLSDIPAVSQSQLVQSYRVTKHRLQSASWILDPAITIEILAWPDPINDDAVRDLPNSFYDLNLGAVAIDKLVNGYVSFEPTPPFPTVPDKIIVAGSSALFKYVGQAGNNLLEIRTDQEYLLTVSRYA